MKMRKILCCFIAVMTVVCLMSPVASVSAAGTSTPTVTFSCPAICANTGSAVSLSSYAVEFSSGKATAATQISWTSDDIAVTGGSVTPAEPGVYKLTATAASLKKTVYLVVKAPADTEYVLYYDDFSADTTANYRAIQQSTGAKYSISNGKLTLDASNGDSSYIRLLLPEWIGDFGDYSLSTSFTITKATATSRWLSVMARVQNNNYPYWHAAIRQNATASNGIEIAERNASNDWNVTHKGPYTEKISASKYYELNFKLIGDSAITSINGNRLLQSGSMTFKTGDVGLQVRGLSASFDHIKVTIDQSEIAGLEHSLNEVREPDSNIILSPTTVCYLDTAAKLSSVMTTSPMVGVMYVNSALEVTDAAGTKIATLDDALAKLEQSVIPAFYIRDDATAAALSSYLGKNKIVDAYVMSSDQAMLKNARSKCTNTIGILDCSAYTLGDDVKASLLDMRTAANSAKARVILIPAQAVTAENVEYLQRMFMTVWATTDDTTVGNVNTVVSGVNGIVTSKLAELEKVFTEYFKPNTMVRPVNVIAHRGSPSLGQENTVHSSVLAYNKGATMIEMDVYLSKDGTIVVMHDDTIDRTTNGTGKTESFTVAQLQQYVVDANTSVSSQPIPTLEDYFKEFKDKDVQLVVEIKSNANTMLEKELADLVKQYDMADQVNVITFSESHMRLMYSNLPGVSVGYLTGAVSFNEEDPHPSLESALKKILPFGTTFNPSYAGGSLGKNMLNIASHRGLTLWPYTINDSAIFDEYFMAGMNGVTTNYSQFVTNYVKRIEAPESHISATPEGVDFKILKTTYGRNTTEITNAEMVVIDDGGLELSYENGKLTSKGDGTATVMFRLACKTTHRDTYYVCTNTVTIGGEGSETTTPPAATETTPAPEATTPADPAEQTTPADKSKQGCGSALALGTLLCLIPAAAAVMKRTKND